MQRSPLTQWTILCLSGLMTVILTAGCGHHTTSAVPTPAPLTTAAAPSNAAPAAFQPYTLLPPPPPAPMVATTRHRVLHLTRIHNQVYLADSERHLYEAGRDPQGHIYPIYRDPVTRVTYPLYYDPSRDNLYRLARQEDGRFYRNYVGQPDKNFYATDRDYERIIPNDEDRPIVTDSYNTYNYNTYNEGPNSDSRYGRRRGYSPYYAGYRPPPRRSSHFNDNWLWAIPVIIGAYLLLQPHHHAPPHPISARPNQVIVQQITRVNVVNQIIQAAPVGYRPIASPRPVYVSRLGNQPLPIQNHSDVLRHGALPSVVAAPMTVAAVHAAAPVRSRPRPRLRTAQQLSLVQRALPVSRPVPPVRLSMPLAYPTSLARHSAPPARPVVLVHHPVLAAPHSVPRPLVRQARLATPARPIQRVHTTIVSPPAAAHPVVRMVSHGAGHPSLTANRRIVTPGPQARAPERPRAERARVIVPPPTRPAAPKPRPVARPRFVSIRQPASRPVIVVRSPPSSGSRPQEIHAVPRVERPAPRVERPAAVPGHSEPPRPAAQPRVARSAPSAPKHTGQTKPISTLR